MTDNASGKAVAKVKEYEDVDGDTQHAICWLGRKLPHDTKLYTRPSLTPEAVRRIAEKYVGKWGLDQMTKRQAIEAAIIEALGEGNE